MNKYINLSFRKSLLEETCIPTIFKTLGLCGMEVELQATGIYGVVKVTAFLLFAADSWDIEDLYYGQRFFSLFSCIISAFI
jgi:hypothetical protein